MVVIGLDLIGGGLHLAYQAWRREFRRDLELGQMRARTRRVVEWLGRYGGIARGIVFVTAGIFLVVAAVDAKPQQAKGIDSSLRALAATPLGPWLLVLVAIGLIMFGLFSCSEAEGGCQLCQHPPCQPADHRSHDGLVIALGRPWSAGLPSVSPSTSNVIRATAVAGTRQR